jgi:hypothetical protein
MSTIFDRLRTGAGKAAFEADKLRRVASVQSTIKSLKEEVNKAFYQVGHVAYALYSQGKVAQPELKEVCDHLAALQAQIAGHEQEIESIRAEKYVEPAASSTSQYGRVCPNGHGPIPLPNNFCQTCGARAVDISPPAPAAAVLCRNCHSPLPDAASFCANCGQPVAEPMADASAACRNCGAALPADSLFCSECGQPVVTETVKPEAEAGQDPAEAADQTGAEWPTEVTLDWDDVEDETPFPLGETREQTVAVNTLETQEAGTCPACDNPLLPDATFCAECGYRVLNPE